MSFSNPTQLQLGMTGILSGKSYRVIGRVVMGVVDDGEIYHWNEFNLQDQAGETVTLVYERTERGGEWRLFNMFEPTSPFSAGDAALKREGDCVDIGEGPTYVQLRDTSRVYYIEGIPPEQVKVGDTANYFNAQSGSRLTVVSWTGDEVEFYHGLTLQRGTVEKAFGIREPQFSNIVTSVSGPANLDAGKAVAALGVFALVLMLFGSKAMVFRTRAPAVKILPPPASPLSSGAVGKLGGTNYQIIGHELVDMEEVGLRFTRHEFRLRDGDGNEALLECGITPGASDYYLFSPLHPLEPLTPEQAANVRLGQVVNIDGFVAPVRELFRSTTRSPEHPSGWQNAPRYCFLARTNSLLLLARWNQAGITFDLGRAVTTKTALAAFGQK